MRERALLLGGELTIRRFTEQGTTVRVRIPEPNPPPERDDQMIRILIADDHAILRRGLKEILVRELDRRDQWAKRKMRSRFLPKCRARTGTS